jgi:ketosteroid isomerase-like protein
MAAEHDTIDTARIERLERRLRVLEDIEAVRNLKTLYAAHCDDDYNYDAIAALFAEDAVWEHPVMGRCEGREAIRSWFKDAAGIFSFAVHYSLNGQIHIDGDRAEAQWYLFMPCVMADDGRAMWRAGIDREKYARVGEEWLFTHKTSEPLFHSPFDEGWAKTRFA